MAGTITHKWDGTTLIVTSDSGTSSCDLKGAKGDAGIRGAQGAQGEPYEGLSLYPVGAIYLSTVDTSPASTLGGTWARLKDRFLLGAGDNYSAGVTGGSATHTLTTEEIPSHSHKTIFRQSSTSTTIGGVDYGEYVTGSSYYEGVTTATGGGKAHNNMPPYLAVYMWQRTA